MRSASGTQRVKWLISVLAFLLVNGYITYQFYREWPKIQAFDWSTVNISFLYIAIIVQFSSLLVSVLGWAFMLKQFGSAAPWLIHFKILTLSNLARKLPIGLGLSILSRAYFYTRDTTSRAQIVLMSLLEVPIFGIASLIVVLLTSLLPNATLIPINIYVLIGLLTACLLLIPSPVFRFLLNYVSRHQLTEQALQPKWYHFYIWIVFAALMIVLGGYTMSLFTAAIGFTKDPLLPSLVQCWALIVLSGTIAGLLPVDIGINNSMTLVLLTALMPMHQSLLLLIGWRIWTTLNEIVWGILGLLVDLWYAV